MMSGLRIKVYDTFSFMIFHNISEKTNMNRLKLTTSLGLLSATLASTLFLATSSFAEDCPRGDLDERFCDRDGDLVADAPTDPSQWLDPDTLIFAYTPVEDPAVYKSAWSDFIAYMEKTTGKKVIFFPVQSNAAEIEAMRSGRLHVAGFNTGIKPSRGQLCWLSPLYYYGRGRWQFRL